MIGVGVTTFNRRELALDTLNHIYRYTPSHYPVVVVDDGSALPFPGANHRNQKSQGIAAAKNHCLRLLMADPDIEHLFLFDDDCHPTEEDWWKPYVESGEHHLAYLHDNMNPAVHTTVYDDGKIVARVRGTACMLYFTRHAIETVGGFRTEYGRWGFEHDDLSHRIMNAGLTRFPYQGVSNQHGIWNLDEHEHGHSSVTTQERASMIAANKKIFEKYRWDATYVPYE